jgi:hypothetical protein
VGEARCLDVAADDINSNGQFSLRRIHLSEFAQVLSLLALYKYANMLAATDSTRCTKMLEQFTFQLDEFYQSVRHIGLLCLFRQLNAHACDLV